MNVRVIARASTGAAQVPDRLSLADDCARLAAARAGLFRPGVRLAADAHLRARRSRRRDWRDGPLLVEEFDSTTVVPPDGRAPLHRVGHHRNRARVTAMTASAGPRRFARRRCGRRSRAIPFALELIKNALVALADEMALTVYAHGALVRGQGGARLLDRAVPRRRPADRAGHLPAVPSRRDAVRGQGGRRAPSAAASCPGDLFITNDPYDGSTHLPDIVLVKPIFHRRAPDRVLGGARPHDRHRRPHPRRQRQRLDRDLPGGPAHPALAAVARGRAGRDDVPPDRAQRARARQGARRHPLAGRRLRGRRARDDQARASATAPPSSSSTAATCSTTPSASPAPRSPSCPRARGTSSTISTATASIPIRSASRRRSRSAPTT